MARTKADPKTLKSSSLKKPKAITAPGAHAAGRKEKRKVKKFTMHRRCRQIVKAQRQYGDKLCFRNAVFVRLIRSALDKAGFSFARMTKNAVRLLCELTEGTLIKQVRHANMLAVCQSGRVSLLPKDFFAACRITYEGNIVDVAHDFEVECMEDRTKQNIDVAQELGDLTRQFGYGHYVMRKPMPKIQP
jgi:histone H3/H4